MKRSEWIPVTTSLPDFEVDVLLFDDWITREGDSRKDIRVGYLKQVISYKTNKGVENHPEWGTEYAFNITHWMPLPEPPK